jgi:hypothetical protein
MNPTFPYLCVIHLEKWEQITEVVSVWKREPTDHFPVEDNTVTT